MQVLAQEGARVCSSNHMMIASEFEGFRLDRSARVLQRRPINLAPKFLKAAGLVCGIRLRTN